MKTAAMIFGLALVGSQALAQEQTRIYGRTAGASARPPLMARSSPPSHALLMSGSVANLLYFARV